MVGRSFGLNVHIMVLRLYRYILCSFWDSGFIVRVANLINAHCELIKMIYVLEQIIKLRQVPRTIKPLAFSLYALTVVISHDTLP